MTKNVTVEKIYVTVFQNFAVFRKFSDNLAWVTEVLISELLNHNLNEGRFME